MSKSKSIIAVDVFLEKRKSREYVGRLEKQPVGFVFTYEDSYVYSKSALALGPDIPLSKKKHISKKLFPTFEDRIPSRRNPAYNEYAKSVKISPDEKDVIVLVSTLGARGPSSFIFAPVYGGTFGKNQLREFRKKLGLSIREFADVFGFTSMTIHRIETGKTTGRDALKRLELYFNVPDAALFELRKNQNRIKDEVKDKVEKHLNLNQ